MSENKTPDTEKLGEESIGMMKRIRRAYSLMTIEPLMLLLGNHVLELTLIGLEA